MAGWLETAWHGHGTQALPASRSSKLGLPTADLAIRATPSEIAVLGYPTLSGLRKKWILSPRVALSRNAYMLSSMSVFSFVLSYGESPLGGLWNEGERSEPSGTTRPAASGGFVNGLVDIQPPAPFRGCLCFPLMLSLLRQGTEAGPPAQGVPVGCASSINSRMVCNQSVAQLEPRTSSAPNSNRCLNDGLGHQFACIRLS